MHLATQRIPSCLNLLVVAIALLQGGASLADWPNYRGPNHDGISTETAWIDHWPSSGPTVLWRSQVGIGFSSCSIANHRLFTLGNTDGNETLYCLNADTGALNWRYDYDCDLDDRFFEGGPTSTPTVDGSVLYSINREGDLSCIQVLDGMPGWKINVSEVTGARVPGWGFSGSPLVLGDRLILNVGESGAAFNKLTGELIWKSGDSEAGYMTPVPVMIDKQQCVLIASGKFYQCVECESGKVLWKHRWLTTYGCNAACPVIRNNLAMISSGYGRGSAVLEMLSDSCRVLWANQEMQNQFNSSVLLDEMVYGFDGDEGGEVKLKCIEFASGKTRWSYEGLGSGSLMAADGKLIVLSQQGELLVASANSKEFRPVARAKVLNGKCWTVPVLSNGKIYCRDAAGEVVCLDVQNRP